jgi:hypothetical protein
MDDIREWQGDAPVFLLVVKDGEQHLIDVDEKQWLTTYKELLEGEATWHLGFKPNRLVISMVVHEGEKPYYMARHIGQIGMTADNEDGSSMEVVAYGIGAKRRGDGHTDRLWVFPNGQVCMGEEDVYDFAHAMLAK